MWTPLHACLQQTLRQRWLLPEGARILVAVSGGQDSLCLLALLRDLQPKWLWHLAVGHCDHRWETDAGIADRVAAIARDWQLPFYASVAAEPVPPNEAAARHWRYQALGDLAAAAECARVAVAHTRTDRAETLLYNLIRGSGTDGLPALGWQRELAADTCLVRPLLEVTRQQTAAFCQQRQLPVWEDAANADLRFARNRLRAEVFPYLKENFNPNVETAIAQAAEILQADRDYLQEVSADLAARAICPLPPEERQFQGSQIDRRLLGRAPLALQRRVLRRFLQQYGNRAPTFAQIEQLVGLLSAPNRSRTSSLAALGGAWAEVAGNWIRVRLPGL